MTMQGLTIATLLLTTIATLFVFLSSVLPAAIYVFLAGVLVGLVARSIRSNNSKNASGVNISDRKF
jgi:uncharacterized membrane protein (DUF106 family)